VAAVGLSPLFLTYCGVMTSADMFVLTSLQVAYGTCGVLGGGDAYGVRWRPLQQPNEPLKLLPAPKHKGCMIYKVTRVDSCDYMEAF
jgi:hypothetical protein